MCLSIGHRSVSYTHLDVYKRQGRLRIGNAYGSELLDLSVPVQSQYWNGTAVVQNSADNCTSLAGSNVSLARYQGGLSAVHMGASHVIVAPIVAGIGRIKLTKPTPATQGSVDLFLNLGSVGSVSYTHLDVYKRQRQYESLCQQYVSIEQLDER